MKHFDVPCSSYSICFDVTIFKTRKRSYRLRHFCNYLPKEWVLFDFMFDIMTSVDACMPRYATRFMIAASVCQMKLNFISAWTKAENIVFIEYKAPFQIGVLSIREGCASFCYNGFRIIVNPDIRIDSEQREKLTNIAIVIANQKLEKFLCSFKRNYFPVTTLNFPTKR